MSTQKIYLFCLFSFLFTSSFAAPLPKEWYLHNSDYFQGGIEKLKSNPIHGDQIAYLQNFELKGPDIIKSIYESRSAIGRLSQTISAKNLRGKHFHISAYAALSKKSTELLKKSYLKNRKIELNKKFPNLSEKEMTKRIESIKKRAHTFIDYFSNDATFGIDAYIHLDNKILKGGMTGPIGKPNPKWQRFNIEIDIPSNATHITIVFWAKGLGKFLVDHFAFVERGSPTTSALGQVRNSKFTEELKLIKLLPQKEFSNLSFEKN